MPLTPVDALGRRTTPTRDWQEALMAGGNVSLLSVPDGGAAEWETGMNRHRFEAMLSLAVLLIVGGLFLRFSGDPWALIGAFVSLGGFGVLLVAFEAYRRSTRRDPAVPDTWQ